MKMEEIPLELSLDERQLGTGIDHLLEMIDGTIHRGEGTMGNNTSKTHLLAHVPQYTSAYGPPTGQDSADSERNHKTQVKKQANWTQRREDTFMPQFGQRWTETRLVSNAISSYRRIHGLFPIQEVDAAADLLEYGKLELGGSTYEIGVNDRGLPTMAWQRRDKRGRTTHRQVVIDYIGYELLHRVTDNVITGKTEVKVRTEKESFIVRAHPNYRSDSNQKMHQWYDWVYFRYETPNSVSNRPGLVVAIVDIGALKTIDGRTHRIRNRELLPHRPYAVVRLFTAEPKLKFRQSCLDNQLYTYSVRWGQLSDGFHLLPLLDIVAPAIVVPNVEADPTLEIDCPDPLDGGFFVIPSRQKLGQDFLDLVDREWDYWGDRIERRHGRNPEASDSGSCRRINRHSDFISKFDL